MSPQKIHTQPSMEDLHAALEKTLIETNWKGKGHRLEEAESLPKAEARPLMQEASTHAFGKLAELEASAHCLQELHCVD